MLRYKQERYDDGRERVDMKLILDIFTQSLQDTGVKITKRQATKSLLQFLSSVTYSFYSEPEKYIDLKGIAVYRQSRLENLLSIDTKGEMNAKQIYDYYKDILIPSLDMNDLVEDYVIGLADDSTKAQEKVNKSITKLQQLQEKEN